jgi:hypothetical protein
MAVTASASMTAGSSLLVSWCCSPPPPAMRGCSRSDLLAVRLARDDEAEPVHIEDTDTAFTIGWTGRYRIDGPAFVYSDRQSGRVATILGYPTDGLADTA